MVTPEQEIAILRARVAHLEREVERLRAERSDAPTRNLSVEPPESSRVPRIDAANACEHCEGYGSHWIHDIELPCLKCNGTGRRAT